MPLLDQFSAILRQNEPLAPLTWLRVGGPAQFLAEPRSAEELASLVEVCHQHTIPVRVLGGGSNLLVSDSGVQGVVVRLNSEPLTKIAVEGRRVTAGGGATLAHLVSITVREGLAGLEPLVGIPGTVGGALHGNAGGRTGDIGQWTKSARVLTKTGQVLDRGRDELVFAYRESSLDELCILSAEFELVEDDPQELARRMQKQWIVTKANQPPGHEQTSFAFKNPRGISAGMLLEQAGLKGATVGGAELSERHPNFLITRPGATSADVLKLLETARAQVERTLGVQLEPALTIW
jgi:UDP-N-acetylmuramate dehydrogenase